MTDSKLEQQRAIEADALDLGITRYRRDKERKDLTDLKPGQQLASATIKKLTVAVEAEMKQEGARRGKPSIYMPYFEQFQPEVLAYVTARTTINQLVQKPPKLNSLSVKIGSALQDALIYEELRPMEPDLFSAMERKANRATTSRHRKAVIATAARTTKAKHGYVTDQPWTEDHKFRVGAKLIELLVASTGLVTVEEVRSSQTQSTMQVLPTPYILEWLDRQHSLCEMLKPMYMPMVIPPKDWVQPLGGGYLGVEGAPGLPLVKTQSKVTIDDLFSTDMPDLYQAINAIQRTKWQINGPILDVVKALAETDSEIGCLPRRSELDIPPPPADIDTNQVSRKKWSLMAAQIHQLNARYRSKRIALAQQIYVADRFRAEPAIYFPHQVDFRGRAYPTPQGVNPQKDDVGKSLLKFAEGKRLGEEGAFWLAVHLANTFGEDKLSLEDRVQWTLDNTDKIVDSGVNPLDGQMFWQDADKPFGFLAACFEWVGYQVQGEDYVSHLPVAMDGACSGIQHYSALLRDPVGGAAVNLVPQDKPADLYMRVAEKVTAILAETDDPLAVAWADKVTRKIVKRPCMTYAYSVTPRGVRDQILDEMRKHNPNGDYLPGWTEFEAAAHLAPIVFNAIRESVVAAAAAMDWLKVVVRELSSRNLPCVWTNPAGMPVMQRRMEIKSKKVKIYFEGRRVRVSIAEETLKINSRKQLNSVAPNFIHGMDAGHLLRTVKRCVETTDIQDFAMIHDSYGTHACNVGVLGVAIRDEFVAMYREQDWLEAFKAEVESSIDAELPPCPARGTLDLSVVLDSDYFFA